MSFPILVDGKILKWVFFPSGVSVKTEMGPDIVWLKCKKSSFRYMWLFRPRVLRHRYAFYAGCLYDGCRTIAAATGCKHVAPPMPSPRGRRRRCPEKVGPSANAVDCNQMSLVAAPAAAAEGGGENKYGNYSIDFLVVKYLSNYLLYVTRISVGYKVNKCNRYRVL